MDARHKAGHDDFSVPSMMAGLAPAIDACNAPAMNGGFVYILTNRPNGTLYVGVTSDLVRRVWEHRQEAIEGFTSRYRLKTLVFFEQHDDITAAIQREKSMKHWSRAWKVRLILASNPDWRDLYDDITA